MQAAAGAEKRRLRMAGGDSCKPGCHSCCHRHVEITVAEGAVIVAHLRSSGAWGAVRKAAKALADLSKDCSPDSWFKMKVRCPVLSDDGMCSAYPVRPPSCSTHFVTSHPSGCDPWSPEKDFSPVDMSDLYVVSQMALRDSIPAGGIMGMTLPLPLALLVADRVAIRTDLNFEQAMSLIRSET